MSMFGRIGSRLALVGLLAATLGLTACGRKGPLDLPPASAADAAQAAADAQAASDAVPRIANDPPPRRKPLPIDAILN